MPDMRPDPGTGFAPVASACSEIKPLPQKQESRAKLSKYNRAGANQQELAREGVNRRLCARIEPLWNTRPQE
jgi:hypothetical protein